MVPTNHHPGPDANVAFRLGMVAAAVVGLALLGFVYWANLLDVLLLGYAALALFPIYLVFAATLLSVWLGYDKGPADLRPVSSHVEDARRE